MLTLRAFSLLKFSVQNLNSDNPYLTLLQKPQIILSIVFAFYNTMLYFYNMDKQLNKRSKEDIIKSMVEGLTDSQREAVMYGLGRLLEKEKEEQRQENKQLWVALDNIQNIARHPKDRCLLSGFSTCRLTN